MSSNEEEGVRMEKDREGRHGGCRGHRYWKIPFIVAAIVLIKSALVMLLWNALIPDLFDGPVVTYFQAMGLTVLAKLLVGFGGRHGGHHHRHPGWKARWARLSPEEREKLREGIRHRCGWGE